MKVEFYDKEFETVEGKKFTRECIRCVSGEKVIRDGLVKPREVSDEIATEADKANFAKEYEEFLASKAPKKEAKPEKPQSAKKGILWKGKA